jgi:hypothetical protein
MSLKDLVVGDEVETAKVVCVCDVFASLFQYLTF